MPSSRRRSSWHHGTVLEQSLQIDRQLDLRRTLQPLLGTFRHDGWWLTAHTPQGPGTLRVSRSEGRLHGRAWGEGAEHLLVRLGRICGLEDDGGLVTDHPLVGELNRRNPGLRFGATGAVFAHLVAAIVGQKVTRTEADRAMAGLRREFGVPAPGPVDGLRLPPDAEQMAAAPYWVYHELHLEKRRADTLRLVAARSPSVDSLAESPPDQASAYLLSLPGIGPWTVAKTLAPSHGDQDQLEVGDYHTKNLVVFHLTGRPRGSDEEMVELLEPFRPYRGRVVRLLHTLGHAPKFGPRSKPRDITRI